MCSHAKRLCSSKSTDSKTTPQFGEPLTRFGVITDTHYADCDDRVAWYDSSKTRYYRNAINQIHNAFNEWIKEKDEFVVHLGDIIDGCNEKHKHYAINYVFNSFNRLPSFFVVVIVCHLLGNHELYNFNRIQLSAYLSESVANRENVAMHQNVQDKYILYYTFKPVTGVKLIALDCFDVSVLGHSKSCVKYQQALKILQNYHKHESQWDEDNVLDSLNKRFLAQNGAIGEAQLSWLNNELSVSEEANEKVIIFGHVGLHPDSVDSTCLLWNYEQILNVFKDYKCIKMYICGHQHKPGFAQMNHIRFVVFDCVIETEFNTFASIIVFNDRIVIKYYNGKECCIFKDVFI
ncbi:manganese-dependent ADP-ribose/CDP-alcohol diphosphatase-like isoform X1 [Leptotrombidium deliense]|uniref:Manganese-dependent ADP-ribose/CDP-alcohol diphosphatase-like isoform X1 n=1 Tax=Leptotrombidium deliense TaxID=299467 RepID=A0A443ST95_9ACAR|nr:manganese-dependent ADP-ribose/CDP-alcohol diphosphatase-like isoform X1 [Leptotrombidium deliense]